MRSRFLLVVMSVALSGCATWKVSPVVSFRQPGARVRWQAKNTTVTLTGRVCPYETERDDVTLTRFDRLGVRHMRTVTRRNEVIGYNVRVQVGWRF